MMTRGSLVGFMTVSVALGLAACGGSGAGAASSSGTSVGSLCDTDPRAMTYTAGLSQMAASGTLKVSLVEASPAPPSENLNSWTIKLTDADGNAVDGATISMKPWMPDMGHGSSETPQITPMSGGLYQVTLIDLFMPGIWTNTFTIKAGTAPATTAVLTFCIDG